MLPETLTWEQYSNLEVSIPQPKGKIRSVAYFDTACKLRRDFIFFKGWDKIIRKGIFHDTQKLYDIQSFLGTSNSLVKLTVLLAHSQAHLFRYWLRLLCATTQSSLQSLKYLLSALYRKSLCTPVLAQYQQFKNERLRPLLQVWPQKELLQS